MMYVCVLIINKKVEKLHAFSGFLYTLYKYKQKLFGGIPMNRKREQSSTLPVPWLILLPLIGVVHSLLVVFGWLERGSWLNFIVMLVVLAIWIIVAIRESVQPFPILLIVGSIYGFLTASIHFIHWLTVRPSLGFGATNWTLDQLLTAINYWLIPLFPFAGYILFGLFIGTVAGFVARMISKVRAS